MRRMKLRSEVVFWPRVGRKGAREGIATEKMVSATEKLWSKRGPSAVGGHSSGNLRSEDGYMKKRQK